jgi:hypothetical protein
MDARQGNGRGLDCLLRGRRPHFGGLFIPKDQARVGAPPGKVRAFRFGLCKRCSRRPGTPRRVERLLLGDLDALARRN